MPNSFAIDVSIKASSFDIVMRNRAVVLRTSSPEVLLRMVSEGGVLG